ncbi:Small nuclear ribonucleoprotein-associated protein B [Massospora cicadina]|nr:Small nuclear ribonucleoprotein-associated protein B [Massospora cicadina]
MNLVISDCEEFRKTTPKGSKEEIELKRTLGLVILRGEHIVSISVDGPPPLSSESLKARVAQLAAGSGVGRPAGRGIPIAPSENAPASGLTGPARGLGAPAPSMMQPRVPATSAAPIPYARPIPPGSNMAARPGMPMAPMGSVRVCLLRLVSILVCLYHLECVLHLEECLHRSLLDRWVILVVLCLLECNAPRFRPLLVQEVLLLLVVKV